MPGILQPPDSPYASINGRPPLAVSPYRKLQARDEKRERAGVRMRCGEHPATSLTLMVRGWLGSGEELEQDADLNPLLGGVAHVHGGVDPILVSAAVTFSVDEARLDKVGEDPLRGALGDLDLFSDVAEPDIRSARDTKEDLGVVGEEPPGGWDVSFT